MRFTIDAQRHPTWRPSQTGKYYLLFPQDGSKWLKYFFREKNIILRTNRRRQLAASCGNLADPAWLALPGRTARIWDPVK